RAAKRLVNLYRLVRIGIPDVGLADFTGSESGGPFQVVQILLAVLVGSPGAARQIFLRIMRASPNGDIITALTQRGANDGVDSLCAKISTELGAIAKGTPFLKTTAEYQQWCPRLARYSFHTRDLSAEDLLTE